MATPAAQYLRMSTEHQQFSIDNQCAAIGVYAIQHGFTLIQTYMDEAKTGLVLRERPGLQQLLKDVQHGKPPFSAILVYDVSRWGRFQDTDEAAHYEFVCKAAGIPVHYCAESFGIENSLVNTLLKSIKRSMASEYSRELSAKVSAAQKRLTEMGYRQGGIAGYGFRRLLLSNSGDPKQVLRTGERKSLQTERVTLIHGPVEEVECVREIYRMVTEEKRTPTYIARELNRRGVAFMNGTPWYQEAVTRILNHPKYAGFVVWGQREQKLHTRSKAVPRERWVVSRGRHEGIVSKRTYEEAQAVLSQRTHYMTNEQLLDGVRELWQRKGKLSIRMIDESPSLPSNRVFIDRFGSFWNVCRLIGYEEKGRIFQRTKSRLVHQDMRRELMEEIVSQNINNVRIEKRGRRKNRLRLKDGTVVAVVVARCLLGATGEPRWLVSRSPLENRSVSLLVLLNSANDKAAWMYLATRVLRLDFTLWHHDIHPQRLQRVESFDCFVEQVRRAKATLVGGLS